jgi:hypothetical protein
MGMLLSGSTYGRECMEKPCIVKGVMLRVVEGVATLRAERSWWGFHVPVQYSDGELQYSCAIGLEVVWWSNWSYFVVSQLGQWVVNNNKSLVQCSHICN